jgi:hypothetical protein
MRNMYFSVHIWTILTACISSPAYVLVLVLLLLPHFNVVRNMNDSACVQLFWIQSQGCPSLLCLSLLTYKKVSCTVTANKRNAKEKFLIAASLLFYIL